MNKIPPNVPDCTIFLLAKAYQKAHAQFQKRLKPYGLTNLQHLVLEGLWYQTGQTAAELGTMLVLDKATLSGVLDRMVDAGWIERRHDSEDRRAAPLFPSARAERMRPELIALRRDANDEMLSPFTLEERILLKRFLHDLM
jgi:DNA-binding MarR family transcriptional regulator